MRLSKSKNSKEREFYTAVEIKPEITVSFRSILRRALRVILFLAILLISSLLIGNIKTVIQSGIKYRQELPKMIAHCRELAETSRYTVYFKDETFFGVGRNGSLGCLMTDELKDPG